MSDTLSLEERRRLAVTKAAENFHLLGSLPWTAHADIPYPTYVAELPISGQRLVVEDIPSGVIAERQVLENGEYRLLSRDTIRI